MPDPITAELITSRRNPLLTLLALGTAAAGLILLATDTAATEVLCIMLASVTAAILARP